MFDDIRGGIEVLGNHGLLVAVATTCIVVLIAIIVWRRTRSTHSLMARIWRLFHGAVECKDATIGKFLDQQSALMEFRFTTGLPVRTNRHAKELIEWVARNGEDIGHVAACGHYFDLESISLRSKDKLPGFLELLGRYIGALVIFIFCIILAIGIFVDRAFLQVKESGTYFTLSSENAKPLMSESRLTREQCSNGKGTESNVFGGKDAKIICDLFSNKEMDVYLIRAIKEQRIIFGVTLIIFGLLGWNMFNWLMQGVRSREMCKRLEKCRGSDTLALLETQNTVGNGDTVQP
ncbi:DUF6216 family protein [Cupriavidus basilensis]|uniref:DUF6216 family protein n=1 Tax=Cupriavidus basilensis TaxID=68895 RepID=UPI0020A66BA1|nr:DUF6216 family protein [Cupriavidus basilensis]MCP3020335.1 DUF6216 family protein [Cupriavidus basilensis]